MCVYLCGVAQACTCGKFETLLTLPGYCVCKTGCDTVALSTSYIIKYICSSLNTYNYYCNGACVGNTCFTNFSYMAYTYAWNNVSYAPAINNLVTTKMCILNFYVLDISSSIIEIDPQSFTAEKNSIFLTIVDTENNEGNITYDVFNGSDTNILCDGTPNEIQALSSASDCLKVHIKAGDACLNKITKYGYTVD